MYSDTNTTRSVADAVMKIMNEKLHPNQQKLDVHEPEKDELTADDFKKLRAGKKADVKKEEIEQDETILEYESKDGKFVHNAKTGRYGGSEKPQDPFAGVRGPGKTDLEKIEKEKKKKKFSEMVNLYQEKGLKSLSEMLIKEEPTNDEYKAELDDVKAKASGTKKNPDIAKGKVDAVKQEEVEQIDELVKIFHSTSAGAQSKRYQKDSPAPEAAAHRKSAADAAKATRAKGGADRYQFNTGSDATTKKGGTVYAHKEEVELESEVIEEKTLTEPEMKKREEIVMSMKKGMAGFKERYGDRAKNVMYATATKQAKKSA